MWVWSLYLVEILEEPILVLSTYFYKIFLPGSSLLSRISICPDHSQLDLISYLLIVHLKKCAIITDLKNILLLKKITFTFSWLAFLSYIAPGSFSLAYLLFSFSLPSFPLLHIKDIDKFLSVLASWLFSFFFQAYVINLESFIIGSSYQAVASPCDTWVC